MAGPVRKGCPELRPCPKAWTAGFRTRRSDLPATGRFRAGLRHRRAAWRRGRGPPHGAAETPPLTAEGHTTSGDPEDLAVAAATERPVYPGSTVQPTGWLSAPAPP